MKTLFGLVPFVLAFPVVVWSAIWQGNHTERWGNFPELSVSAKRIENIPLEVGDWKGTLGPKLDERTRSAAGAVGDAEITYTKKTGERVSVFVVCGRLVDVMNHRPDRCYPAHGYHQEGEKAEQTVETDSGPATFQTATYSREGQSTAARLYWAWSSNGKWLAPEDLRYDFLRTDPMFKVHFENEAGKNDSLNAGPSVDLIKVLIPELSRTLFPPPEKPAAKAAKT